MRKRFGNVLVAVFALLTLSVMSAQVIIPCPPACDPKNLEREYGDDWHLYYALFGCWAWSACWGMEPTPQGLPKAALYQRSFVMRGGR